MPQSTGPSPSSVASSRDSLMAMGAGALMGVIVMRMAEQRGDSGLSLAMAVLFVLSGCASVVLAMLSRPHRLKPLQRHGEVKGWLLALGLGVLGAVQVSALV
jgi:drug/metabolite transporter (DMT)-like permease